MLNKNEFNLPEYDPQNLLTLCESMGFCLLQIQSLELTLQNYLAQVHKLELGMTFVEIEKIFNKIGKFTLGGLFKEISKNENWQADIEIRVRSFVEERNWLVHHCRKKNEKDLYNLKRFGFLVQRIRKLADESLYLNKFFQEKAEFYIISTGIMTKEQLDIETQKILDSLSKE